MELRPKAPLLILDPELFPGVKKQVSSQEWGQRLESRVQGALQMPGRCLRVGQNEFSPSSSCTGLCVLFFSLAPCGRAEWGVHTDFERLVWEGGWRSSELVGASWREVGGRTKMSKAEMKWLLQAEEI